MAGGTARRLHSEWKPAYPRAVVRGILVGLLVVTPLGTLGVLTRLKPFIAARLSADRGEALIWGALPAVVVGVAWAVFALVYRSGVRAQSEGLTLPQPSPSAKVGAAWASFWCVVLVALFLWVAIFPIPRRVGRLRPPPGSALSTRDCCAVC